MKYILYIIYFFLLLTTSCKKWEPLYPEDTERTKLTPYERIYGKWILTKAELNGVDVTSGIYDSLGQYSIEFEDKFDQSAKIGTIDMTLNNKKLSTRWHISYSDIHVFHLMDSYPHLFKFMILGCYKLSPAYSWEIRSLSKSTLKVRKIVNDSTMINYFQKVE